MPIKIEGLTVANNKKGSILIHGKDINNTCRVCGRGMGLVVTGSTVTMACVCGHKEVVERDDD